MGNWTWNTRLGTYEWRESSTGWLTWTAGSVLILLIAVVIIFGLALIRQLVLTDSSTVARVISAGDFPSLLEWAAALGAWALTTGAITLQQYWPFLLIVIPGAAAFVLMRKG